MFRNMLKVIAVIAVVLAGLGYFLIAGIGKPVSSDLSVIGQGKPALVLAYENYSPMGGDALTRLRKVRGDFESKLNFVVAELGSPPGRAFADRYQLHDGLAIFLNQDGQPLEVMRIPEDEQALRSQLEANLAKL